MTFLLAVIGPSAAGADESDGERLLRRVLDARERDGEVRFVVTPDPDWDEYHCWYSGSMLRCEARRSGSKFAGQVAPGLPAMPNEQIAIMDFRTMKDEVTHPDSFGMFRRKRVFLFSHHPHLFGLGWPRAWLPDRAVEALFSGRYSGDRVVAVQHRLRGREERQGSVLTVVESEWDRIEGEPRVRIRRLIDERRGPSVVRADAFVDDRLEWTFESRLKNWDGVWFPERVVRSEMTSAGECKVDREIFVKAASFKRTDPALFKTESLGLEVGTSVVTLDGSGKQTTTVWTGRGDVTMEEFGRLEKAGLVTPGPKLKRIREDALRRRKPEAGRAMGLAPPLLPSGRLDVRKAGDAWPVNWLYQALLPPELWERYVDQVAAAREFDVNRKRAAQGILKELRGRAEAYRASRAEEYKKAQHLPDAKARDAELDRLERGVDDLFKELKDRVERL